MHLIVVSKNIPDDDEKVINVVVFLRGEKLRQTFASRGYE